MTIPIYSVIPKPTGVYVGSKIPQKLKKCIQKAIANGDFLTISDFVRDAIKEKLLRSGYFQSGILSEEGAR